MDKEDVIHIYNRILFSHKKNKIMSFAVTWMDLETVIQSEISQKVKNKYHVNKHMLKNGTGGPICKAEMET